jgi:hypothetical protein
MGLVFKVILAFGIGLGAMAGVQHFWLSSIKNQLRTQQAALPQTAVKPLPKFDAIDMKKFRAAMYPKLDPNIGKDAWRGTLNRQVNQAINAGRMVPQPRHFPGMPRY